MALAYSVLSLVTSNESDLYEYYVLHTPFLLIVILTQSFI